MSTVNNQIPCLDHSSTTALAHKALAALLPYLQTAYHSPSSGPRRPAPSGTSKRTPRYSLRDDLLAELAAGVSGRVSHAPVDLTLPNTHSSSRSHGWPARTSSPGCRASLPRSVGHATPAKRCRLRRFATLATMEAALEAAHSAVRLSLGRDTTGASAPLTVDALVVAWRRARDEGSVPQTSKRREEKRPCQ